MKIVKNLVESGLLFMNWVAIYVKNNKVTYFKSFGVGNIPK